MNTRSLPVHAMKRMGALLRKNAPWEQLVRERLRSATLSDGRIDWRGFKRVVAEAKLAVAGTSKTESEIRKLVVTTMEDTGLNRVKTGWLGNWYRKLKRDVGA